MVKKITHGNDCQQLQGLQWCDCPSIEVPPITKPPKFYTAFLYDEAQTGPHCTHKFLGELSQSELLSVAQAINDFKPRRLIAPAPTFKKEEFFQGRVRVLTTPNVEAFRDFDGLRGFLETFKPDDFPFRPHLTTESRTAISLAFTHYALCYGKKVVFAWPLRAA